MRLFIKLLFILVFTTASPLYANDVTIDSPIQVNDIRLDIDESGKVIKAIMSMEAFDTIERRKDWRFNYSMDEEEEQESNSELWKQALVYIAQTIEYILWVIPVILLIIVFYYRNHWLSYFKSTSESNQTLPPETILGIEINQSDLPENITDGVRQLWNQGKEREAISILFRASIMSIFDRYDVEISSGYTENQCIDAVKRSVPNEISNYFENITSMWVRIAYGHIKPEFNVLDTLCMSWDRLFSREMRS